MKLQKSKPNFYVPCFPLLAKVAVSYVVQLEIV